MIYCLSKKNCPADVFFLMYFWMFCINLKDSFNRIKFCTCRKEAKGAEVKKKVRNEKVQRRFLNHVAVPCAHAYVTARELGSLCKC